MLDVFNGYSIQSVKLRTFAVVHIVALIFFMGDYPASDDGTNTTPETLVLNMNQTPGNHP
jgi:hypothetical protein